MKMIYDYSMQSCYYFEPLLYPSLAYIRGGRILSSTQFYNTVLKHSFHMQVEVESIEEHICDKEAAYQRCISTRSCKSFLGQSHISKLFERRTFMVDICKISYINNAIKEYCLLGFSPCIGFPQGICVVDMHVYLST